MKSILIIGMGKFGHHLCRNLLELENEIMIVDKDERAVEDMASKVTSALIADCTREDVLKSLGVSNFDVCFVCLGDNFQSNLEITSLLKDLGAPYVISKSNNIIHTKFLLRNGADEVIHPDKDVAERAAVKYSNDNIFDYIELSDGWSIQEILPPKEWAEHSLKDSNIRARHNISILGIRGGDGHLSIMPPADYIIRKNDHLVILGKTEDIKKIIRHMK